MTTSHAKTVSHSPIKADTTRTNFGAASNDKIAGRGSEMVKKDQPKPILKPGPSLAHEVDQNAFNHRWKAEDRAARKAAFIKERTDPKTGGHIRTLNRNNNRSR